MKLISIVFFIIIFQIINIKCQYVPEARQLHTATLVEEKLYFIGGYGGGKFLNDVFFLDLSKSIDVTKIPFIDLSVKDLPPQGAAAASPYGEDSIFLFGGYVDDSFSDNVAFLFNITQLQWNVAVSQSISPKREATINAVIDNNKIYIFGGGFDQSVNIIGSRTEFLFSSKMNIYDTTNKIWDISESGLPGRDGYTATFLPDTSDIIYIGGRGTGLENSLTNLDAYNTQNNSWRKVTTKNPPESRFGHSAVLTNDRRVVVFGGGQPTSPFIPVNNRYVVLDTKTFEWYIGNISDKTPFRHHTATLYNDYMFIAFGVLHSGVADSGQESSDFLIYKIGDYANFSLENNYIPDPTSSPTFTSTLSTEPKNSNNGGVAVKASLSSILGITTLGFIGFIIFKWYKKTKISKFEHVLNT